MHDLKRGYRLHCEKTCVLYFGSEQTKMSRIMIKSAFCICENKGADQLHGNRAADHHLVFTTQIVQSLFFLNLKFQASNHLLWLYKLVCVGPILNPEDLSC